MLAVGMAGLGDDLHGAAAVLDDGGAVTVALMALMALSQSVAFPNSGALLSRSIDPDHTRARSWGSTTPPGRWRGSSEPAVRAWACLSRSTSNGAFYLGALIVAPAIFLALGAGRAAERTTHLLSPVAAEEAGGTPGHRPQGRQHRRLGRDARRRL